MLGYIDIFLEGEGSGEGEIAAGVRSIRTWRIYVGGSWGALGRSWGALGALLGALGTLLGPLEALLAALSSFCGVHDLILRHHEAFLTILIPFWVGSDSSGGSFLNDPQWFLKDF